MTRVAIALGSNLGDRRAILSDAVARLRGLIPDLRVSPFYDTAPVGVGVGQATFLNAVAAGSTDLPPRALLDALLALERDFGRTRPFPGAARTLDLDLILHGDAIVDEPGLVVPHPRFRERAFVLQPLSDVAPDIVDPVTRADARTLLAALPAVARAGVWIAEP